MASDVDRLLADLLTSDDEVIESIEDGMYQLRCARPITLALPLLTRTSRSLP